MITSQDLPGDFLAAVDPQAASRTGEASVDERVIRDALERAGHNKSEAARLLGISRRTLYRRLDELKIRD